ncbi:MAG: sodium:proton antiporter [Actinomycetia bacterium]|nr:sodium:proton antiporter [Actinomycetes bacterium]
MSLVEVGLVALVITAFALVSGRLAKMWITPPMIFVTFGAIVGPDGLGAIDISIESETVKVIAEITLALLLFTDAARINIPRLRAEHGMPKRMLGFGMPLTIVLGAVFALALFSDLGVWAALLVATILAPTDAALGQAVVTSDRVPVRVRQALNVESGLNDGIAAPLVVIFASLAIPKVEALSAVDSFREIVQQIGFGLLIGGVLGIAVGLLGRASAERNWIDNVFGQLGVLTLAIGAWAFASAAGGSGFIAAFICGLAFGSVDRDPEPITEFTESGGQLLNLVVFAIFGGVFVGPAVSALTWQVALYAVLSLTVVRMIPVAISLTGLGLRRDTVFFVGWFGPRGLASIVFGLVVLEQAGFTVASDLFAGVTCTVLLSVFAHGLTAHPLSDWYGKITKSELDAVVEGEPVSEEIRFRHVPRPLRKFKG